MKKYFFIIVIFIFSFFFITSVNAKENNSEFEYLKITYDFDDDYYYVTYTFKPSDYGLRKYYLIVHNIYLDSIEHNINNFNLFNTAVENYADINFTLDESKEYYIKYKCILPKYTIPLNIFSKEMPRNVYDVSSAPSVDYFQLRFDHPEIIDLTKDKITGIDNFILEKEEGSLVFLAGDKYDVSDYYNLIIYREKVFLSEQKKQYDIVSIIVYFSIIIFLAFFVSFIIKKVTKT